MWLRTGQISLCQDSLSLRRDTNLWISQFLSSHRDFTFGLRSQRLENYRPGYWAMTISLFFKALHSSWFTFLFPISFDVWMSLFVALAVVMISMIILKVMNEGSRVHLTGALMMIMSSLLGQTMGEAPR